MSNGPWGISMKKLGGQMLGCRWTKLLPRYNCRIYIFKDYTECCMSNCEQLFKTDKKRGSNMAERWQESGKHRHRCAPVHHMPVEPAASSRTCGVWRPLTSAQWVCPLTSDLYPGTRNVRNVLPGPATAGSCHCDSVGCQTIRILEWLEKIGTNPIFIYMKLLGPFNLIIH